MRYRVSQKELFLRTAGIAAVIGFFWLAALSVTEAAAGKKVALRYAFKTGQTQVYNMSLDGSVTVRVRRAGETQVPQNTALLSGKFGYTQEVVEINPQDKSGTLKITYADAALQTKVGEQVIANQDVTALAGKTAVLRVAVNGEVLSQEIPQALPPTFQNADFTKMFVIFPDREITVGESWRRGGETQVDDNENFRTESVSNTVYTLAGIERRNRVLCAKIEIATDSRAKTVSKREEMKFDGRMSGRVEGVVYYDIGTGFAVHSDLTVWVNNEVSTDAPEGSESSGQTVTILETSLRTVTERR